MPAHSLAIGCHAAACYVMRCAHTVPLFPTPFPLLLLAVLLALLALRALPVYAVPLEILTRYNS